ncbi:MAG: hypothetical protein WCK76_01960 [Elusimicrobiota bacterium]
MSAEPEKETAAPKNETSAAPAPAPFFGGKAERKGPGPSGPGEPYTPLPDLSRPARPRWVYALAAILLALAAAAGTLFMRERAAAPAAQPAAAEAPAAPGPQAGN